MSIIDSIISVLYKFLDSSVDSGRERYSKSNLTEFGKKHGVSDEEIERVYNKAQNDLDDAECGVEIVKDTIDNVRDAFRK